MTKDYSGKSLRGQRFVGQDLRGAAFRNADLRGASFRRADLTGADLRGARLGRGGWRVWVTMLVGPIIGLVVGLLAALGLVFSFSLMSGFRIVIDRLGSLPTGLHAVDDLWITAGITLGVYASMALAARLGRLWGLVSALGISMAAILAVGLTGAVAFVAFAALDMERYVTGGAALMFVALVLTVAGAVAVSLLGAGAVAVALAGTGTGIGTVAISVAVALAAALTVVLIMVFSMDGTAAGSVIVVMAALAPIIFAWYLRRRALVADPQLAALRRWTLTIAAWPGTDFRGAVLTDVNLAGARLRFARLAKPKDLTRTRLRGARDLHMAHVKGTILTDRRVRDLLVSGDGASGDFDHADLHGAWLAGASLRGARFCDAELTGADLTDADLTDADLSRATLIGADLTGATLTGACLDGWNIDTDTRLAEVRADYVFLEAGPDGTPRERRPQGEGLFGPGDFTTLFQRALKTVDLIFRDGVDWDAFRTALDKLRVHYAADGDGREQEVRVQAIENTADGRIIIRIAVPDGADKDADYRRILEDYRQQVAALEHAKECLALEHKVELADDKSRHARELLEVERRHKDELVAAERRSTDRLLEGFIDDHVTVLQQHIMAQNFYQSIAEAGQVATGDIVNKTVNQTGNFSGSIINIDARLERVTQGIGALPNLDADTKACLAGLVEQLRAVLAQVPEARAGEAEAVAVFTSELIDKAAAQPNPSVLRIGANNLLDAARALADKAAPVVKLVEQIIGLLGFG